MLVGAACRRNHEHAIPCYSALYLVLAFFQSALHCGCCIEAEFLAVVLVLVYVGAVMVLFLFVVMMLDINVEEMRRGLSRAMSADWRRSSPAGMVARGLVHVLWH